MSGSNHTGKIYLGTSCHYKFEKYKTFIYLLLLLFFFFVCFVLFFVFFFLQTQISVYSYKM